MGADHDGAVYDIAGARLLDDRAIAAALTRHHGHPVDLMEVSDAAYRDGLIAGGVPAESADVLTGFGEAIRAGSFETPLGDFEALIGHPSLAIEDFLARERSPTR